MKPDDAAPWLQEREDFPLGGGEHTFTISVTVRGSGSDYESDPMVVKEKAFNLSDAIRQASARPFTAWFEAEINAEQEQDHTEALSMEALGADHDEP